jgi:hypothetical protein
LAIMNYSNFTINALVAGNNQLHNQFASAQRQLSQQAAMKPPKSLDTTTSQFHAGPTQPGVKASQLGLKSNASSHLPPHPSQSMSVKQSLNQLAESQSGMKLMPSVGSEWRPPTGGGGGCRPGSNMDMPPQAIFDAQAFATAAAMNASKNLLLSSADFYFKQPSPIRPQLTIEQLMAGSSSPTTAAINQTGAQHHQSISAAPLQSAFQQITSSFGPYSTPAHQNQTYPPSQTGLVGGPHPAKALLFPGQSGPAPPPAVAPAPSQQPLRLSHRDELTRPVERHTDRTPHTDVKRQQSSPTRGTHSKRHRGRDNDQANRDNNENTNDVGENDDGEDEEDDDDTGRRRARKTKIPKTVS